MAKLGIAILLFIGLLTLGASLPSRRTKRQGFNFKIIANSSLPCEQQSPKYKRSSLSDSEKASLFEALGGTFIPNLMADNVEDAKQRFTNLLPISSPFRAKVMDYAKSQGKESRLLRSTVVDFLKYHKAELRDRIAKAAKDSEIVENINGKISNLKHEGHRVEKHEGRELDEDRVPVDTDVVEEDMELHLPEDLGLEPKIMVNGKLQNREMCYSRGALSYDGVHLYMCSTCATWTDEDKNMWPSILNEAYCVTEDPNCLWKDNYWHGKCQDVMMVIEVLKKVDGQCVLALQNGEKVVIEDWQIENQYLRTGCECTVSKYSYFSQYL